MIYVRHSANLPLTQAASLVTIQSSAGIIAALIAGPVTDRFGRKWVMVFSLAGNGLAYFFMGNAHTYLQFAVLMIFMGTFNPLYRVGADAMLADLNPHRKQTRCLCLVPLEQQRRYRYRSTHRWTAFFNFLFNHLFLCWCWYAGIRFITGVSGLDETLPKLTGSATWSIKPSGGYLRVLRDYQFLSFVGAFILAQMCAVTIWILMPDYANRVYSVPVNLYALDPHYQCFNGRLFTSIRHRHHQALSPSSCDDGWYRSFMLSVLAALLSATPSLDFGSAL